MSEGSEHGRLGRLPDFIVIGAAKAGTTSLHFYLSLHPEIFMTTPKEPRFSPMHRSPLGDGIAGEAWYRSLFVTTKRLAGETSPTYAAAPSIPGVPARIAAMLPSAKLIYVVRQPFDRLVSEYSMFYRTGRTDLSFADFLQSAPHTFDKSCYGTQLAGYLEYFPSDRVMVVESDSLKHDRATTMMNVFSFLGADPRFRSPLFHHQRHIGWHEPYLSPRCRRIENSPLMEKVSRLLPHNIFTALKNVLLRPFSVPAPSTELPPDLKNRIDEKLLEEVQLLRRLTGLLLTSLAPAGRSKHNDKVLSNEG